MPSARAAIVIQLKMQDGGCPAFNIKTYHRPNKTVFLQVRVDRGGGMVYNLDIDFKRRSTTVLELAREHAKKMLVADFYSPFGVIFFAFGEGRADTGGKFQIHIARRAKLVYNKTVFKSAQRKREEV